MVDEQGPPARPQLADRGKFRWRGHGDVSRIEGFSDTVFAVVLTLTIVSTAIPKTFDDLMTVVTGFAAFGIAFVFLIQLWYFHYMFFRRFNLQDDATIVINAALLFVILFYTFPLKFLFTLLLSIYAGVTAGETIGDQQWPALMTVYGVGLCLVYWLFALLYFHAYQCREHLKLDARELYLTRFSVMLFLLNGSIGLISIATVWLTRSPPLSGFVYFLTAPLNVIGQMIQTRGLRKIVAVEGAAKG